VALKHPRSFTLAAVLLLLGVTTASGGPLFDAWLERFQVGAVTNTAPLKLEDGYPAGLLAPVRPDTAWVRGALRCLDAGTATPAGTDLARRWLAARSNKPDEALQAARRAVQVFADTTASLVALRAVDGAAVLDGELGARRFFAALKAGDLAAARTEADALAARQAPGLEPREPFTWGLRARRVARMGGGPAAESSVVWSEALPLPSYDAANAWLLWVAYCRDRGQPPLAVASTSDAWRAWLNGVGRGGGISSRDLMASGWPEPWRAAVGAAVLPTGDLDDHFRRYASPPADADLQGMWITGYRLSRRGSAAGYEEIAALPGLRATWRLDFWRRAAELRLLAGQDAQARRDLDRALELARAGEGTTATRRRLRQWVEQAMVLHIAQGDLATARATREAGRAAFSGQDLATFNDETRQWESRLSGGAATPDTTDGAASAAWLVATGRAPAARPAGPAERAAFAAAADRPLWDLWARWGLALADTGTGERGSTYLRRLQAVKDASDPSAAALAAVAPLLDEPRLLGQALDADIARLTGGGTAPRPSLIPALVQKAGRDYVQIHALLGFALAAGDLRGTLGAASLLPQRGLTAAERRLFLYPLPGPGPVRDALLKAGNDPALLLAVARNESLFEAGVRSWAGALGWMQIMPFHYERRGALPGARNWTNAPVSIAAGDRLLADGTRRYHGDPYRMLAAYNAGPEATDRWDRQLGGRAARDIYLAWIGYPETRHYVEKVLTDRAIYQGIIAGPAPATGPVHD
jgi:hypothetical protein